MFDGWEFDISPCIFASHSRFNCNEVRTCWECANKPIPADIAEKLGIRPIDKSCETCKYRDKAWDEDPCVKCRNTASGQREMDEMPDLWEEAQNE